MAGFWTTASISLKCTIVSNVVFWPLALLGLCVDHLAASGSFPRLTQYKVQPNRHLSRKECADLILLAAFNMLVVAPIICCPVFEAMWNCIQGSARQDETGEWRWVQEMLIKVPIHSIIAELWFYAVHILLHRSAFLYGTIHKVHHRFTSPTAMTCVYAHPLEFAITNIMPIFVGVMVTNAHPLTCYLFWFPGAMIGTLKGHCGYRMPWLGPDPHDEHHLYFRNNYGGMALADMLFGTYQKSKII